MPIRLTVVAIVLTGLSGCITPQVEDPSPVIVPASDIAPVSS
ncbi:MAG: hypothetical protein WBA67_12145 [Jannaschia sp.]